MNTKLDRHSVGALHERYRPPRGYLYRVDPRRFVVPNNDSVSRIELVDVAQAVREYRIRAARENFSAFMEYCFTDEHTRRPYQQQWFHDEWAAAMDTGTRVLIIAPRDHGKTSQIIGRVIWELGRDPNLRVKIACASDGRAKERLFEVVQHIEHNPRVLEVFPHLRPSERGEWSKHKIVLERSAFHRDASVEAIGITATATGGRCDLLIADDVVDRRNALSFPALREQIKQAWKSDWTNLLEPESRIWYICTLWHKDDLSHQLMKNKAFTMYFYAINQAYGSMWPEKWSEEQLRARALEIGSVEFNRGFRNNPVDDDTAIVKPQWLRYVDLESDEKFMERLPKMSFITSYDTAGTPTGANDQDYSSSCTIAVDPERRHVYVVDAWRSRLSVGKMAEQVIREYRKYRPVCILIEKVGQASLDEWVLNLAPDLAGVVEVTKPRVSKAQRLLSVTPLMERGDVTFSSYLDPDGQRWSVERGSLPHELLDFPFGKHDDMVDAFSQALDGARRYFLDAWASGRDNVLDIRVGPSAGEAAYPF